MSGAQSEEPTTHPELCLAGLDKAGTARQFGLLWAELGWLGKAGHRPSGILYCTVLCFVLRHNMRFLSRTGGTSRAPSVHPSPGL